MSGVLQVKGGAEVIRPFAAVLTSFAAGALFGACAVVAWAAHTQIVNRRTFR